MSSETEAPFALMSRGHLAEHVLVAGFLEIGGDDFGGVFLGVLGAQAHMLGGPQARAACCGVLRP